MISDRRKRELEDGEGYIRAVARAQALIEEISKDGYTNKRREVLFDIMKDIKRCGYFPSGDAGETGGFVCPEAKHQIEMLMDFHSAAQTVMTPPNLWVFRDTTKTKLQKSFWHGFIVSIPISMVLLMIAMFAGFASRH